MDLPSRAGLVTAWLNARTGSARTRRGEEISGVIDGVSISGRVVATADFVAGCADAQARLYLPTPGHTAGLSGIALECDEVVHVVSQTMSVVLLPPRTGERWWTAEAAHLGQVVPYGNTRADFRRVIREAVEELNGLGLAMHDPTVRPRLQALDAALREHTLPRHLAGRNAELIDQASRVLLIVQIAEGSEGASVTGKEGERRRRILGDAGRGARAALIDAYSAPDTVAP